MTNEINSQNGVRSPIGRTHAFFRGVPLGVLLTISCASFGQVGPYFYGKPNPSTGFPDPPAPATAYYTLGAEAGLPKYLDPVTDPINPPSNPNFLAQLEVAMPERVNRSGNLGRGGAADVTILEDSAEVFMVFASEGAGAKNALGYFIYKGDESPNDLNVSNPLVPGKTYLESRRIVFPNSSLLGPSTFQAGGGGGQLKPGDRVKLVGDQPDGKFSKGVHITWFIVTYGWDGNRVGNGRYTLYSNPNLNPLRLVQAAALDFSTTEGRTIIAFEDLKRTPDGGSDNDFNDVMFYINQRGGQTVFYPDCSGKFVLTRAEHDRLPKDPTGKLVCTTPPVPVTNLSVTAVCSNDPTVQLGWRITNPNADERPYTWVVTDGVINHVKLASTAVLKALPGDNILYTNPVGGVNALTISVEGTVQPGGNRVPANLVPCELVPVVPPLTCCAVFASEVAVYHPGTDRAGKELTGDRKDASRALGASGPAGSFVALGLSGNGPGTEANIVLKFDKPVRGFINVYETTFGPVSANFVETAEVYGSLDGSSFYKIGTANNQLTGSVDVHRTTLELKGAYAQIQYLKLVDATPKASLSNEGDGFDLESVCASDYALEVVLPATADARPGSVKLDQSQTKANQGRRKDGTPVWSSNPNLSSDSTCVNAGLCDPEGIDRSNLTSILARDDAFFSLGIGGSLEVEFREPITGSLIVYERTGDPKPTGPDGSSMSYLEKVAVYGKVAACNEWTLLGYLDNQGPSLHESASNGSFEHQTYQGVLPLGGRTIRYVKLTDITPASSTSKDGYDVDFIASTANASGASSKPDGPSTVNPDVAPVGLVVNAFPNPAVGPLTIDFGYRETGYAPTEATTVSVLHATGKLVSKTVQQAGNTDQMSLDLSGQSDGLYFIAVQLGSGPITYKKLLLQH